MHGQKLLLIWDRIGDYHRARIKALEREVGADCVFYADLGGADNLYGWTSSGESTRYCLLSPASVDQRDLVGRTRRFIRLVRGQTITRIALAGYGRPEYLVFMVLGRLLGCRITLFAESWYANGVAGDVFKGLWLRLFCRAFMVSGELARSHFANRLKVPAHRIFTGYSVVDNDHFAAARLAQRENIILCIARFSPEKDLRTLVSAFAQSRARAVMRLRLIGGGPLGPELRRMAAAVPEIELCGWVAYDDLPKEYGRARFFVLPSRFEPWGLVVNEAMAAGLPVIVSDACGCRPDLVKPANGLIFKAGDEAQLRITLDRIAVMDDGTWRILSDASMRIISGFSCSHWAKQLLRSFD